MEYIQNILTTNKNAESRHSLCHNIVKVAYQKGKIAFYSRRRYDTDHTTAETKDCVFIKAGGVVKRVRERKRERERERKRERRG